MITAPVAAGAWFIIVWVCNPPVEVCMPQIADKWFSGRGNWQTYEECHAAIKPAIDELHLQVGQSYEADCWPVQEGA